MFNVVISCFPPFSPLRFGAVSFYKKNTINRRKPPQAEIARDCDNFAQSLFLLFFYNKKYM